jgi:hypothetical protein
MTKAKNRPITDPHWWITAVAALAAVFAAGCYSPVDSQKYFSQAASKDHALELIHRTALYSVFYDHALRRCVMHSAHTWGQHGGGGGGTGVGVTAFRCDPARIKERVKLLNLQIEDIRDPGETPPWEKLKQQKSAGATGATPPPGKPAEDAKPVSPEPYGEGQ